MLYYHVPRLFTDLAVAHGDEGYSRLLRKIARARLLILDDWGPEALVGDQARDLLEIVEDRYDAGSLVITSQVPVDRWHEMIGIAYRISRRLPRCLLPCCLARLPRRARRVVIGNERDVGDDASDVAPFLIGAARAECVIDFSDSAVVI